MSIQFQNGIIMIHVNYLSMQIYYPEINWKNREIYISAGSIILLSMYADSRKWKQVWSFGVKFLGVGLGIAWKHHSNPLNKRNKQRERN